MNPFELEELASQLDDQLALVVTLREVLRWFDLPTLTVTGKWRIQKSMEELGILCVPELSQATLDTPLEFRRKGEVCAGNMAQKNAGAGTRARLKPGGNRTPRGERAGNARIQKPQPREPNLVAEAMLALVPTTQEVSARAARGTAKEPQVGDWILRVRHLPELRSDRFFQVGPDKSLNAVQSLLVLHGVSVVAVMKGERTPCGVIGWRQIGEASLKPNASTRAIDWAEKVPDCPLDMPFSDAVTRMEGHEALLVREKDQRVVALLTLQDVKEALARLNSPTALLGEIEAYLRHLIEMRLPGELAAQQRDPAGPTFGDYVAILERPDLWARLGLSLERVTVINELRVVRTLRNQHAHPPRQPLNREDVAKLRVFRDFLRKITAP